MGRYIEWQHVAERYPDIARLSGSENVSSSFLAPAEYEIDARLAIAYTTPFSPAPELVKDLCIDLTYYKATFRADGADKLFAYIESRLQGLIAGTIVLPGLTVSGGSTTFSDVQHRTAFGLDDPLNWRPNAESVEATQNERADP